MRLRFKPTNGNRGRSRGLPQGVSLIQLCESADCVAVTCRSRSPSPRRRRRRSRSRSRSPERGRAAKREPAAAEAPNLLNMSYDEYLEHFERMRRQRAAGLPGPAPPAGPPPAQPVRRSPCPPSACHLAKMPSSIQYDALRCIALAG